MTTESATAVAPIDDGISNKRRMLSLMIMALVALCAAIDQSIFPLIIESVKAEFGFSDFVVGLLAGPAFAVAMSIAALAFARWADMGNRRVVIASALGLAGVMTALMGTVQNLGQMVAVRMGAGIGLSGTQAPNSALMSDLFPAHHHGKATSVMMLAGFFGGVAVFGLGGWLLVQYGWRTMVVALGAPGIIIAALAFVGLYEPRQETAVPRIRQLFDRDARAVVASLLKKKTYRQLLMAFAVLSLYGAGSGTFAIPFYMRTYSMDAGQVGFAYGLVFAGSNLIGTLIAAVLVDRMQRRNVKWLLLLPAICCVIALPFNVLCWLVPSFKLSMVMIFIGSSLLAMAIPAILATIFAVIPSHQRAMGMAFLGLLAGLLGQGAGPAIVGGISDLLSTSFGEDALRYTLAGCVVFMAVSTLNLFLGSRTIGTDYVGQRPDIIDMAIDKPVGTPP